MYKVKIYVTLRESVLDLEGNAEKKSLQSMEYKELKDVKIGKYIELTLEKSERDIEEVVREMCERLLVNTVMEDYRLEIEEVAAQ
ncbi:phosphoribosylformylglycinamidine synthase subunit PurS [Bacillus aquiflavi]|uniref:phosphoribosylformylglycinamidine synthase subunit PurS n=1 Tax=Bacillus aquiflavi TaxID=2672567 RepID=UPI001CA9B553|nr:phosphoribosylformylglycinamidine synthase subunit PurS [Bacillus aquiflavi]UAC48614.1 phosphoribosylformylglycinamidine synthase subunit PurS [Bacillus aquiflavi]